MNDYNVSMEQVSAAGRAWTLTTLADRQQYFDPNGDYEAAGIAPAMWSIFGVVWAAGVLLANVMADEPIEDRSILEVGCGLGLASMVVYARGGDITASDLHPLAGEFLTGNLSHNGLADLPFETLDWNKLYPQLGTFDLIIGSDLLYERGQPDLLANFVHRHCKQSGDMILTDPGRHQVGKFNRLMAGNGFGADEKVHGKSKLMRYSRSTCLQ